MAPKEPTRHQLSSRLQYQSRVPAFLQKFHNKVKGIATEEDEDQPQYYDDGSGRPPIPVRPAIPQRQSDDPTSADEDEGRETAGRRVESGETSHRTRGGERKTER